MQDMEFTIEEGKLYLLQTRDGKRTAKAAVKIACDMVKEGLIDVETALLRVDAGMLRTIAGFPWRLVRTLRLPPCLLQSK